MTTRPTTRSYQTPAPTLPQSEECKLLATDAVGCQLVCGDIPDFWNKCPQECEKCSGNFYLK